ncbi:unnamed protein product [Urochloa humidicola]
MMKIQVGLSHHAKRHENSVVNEPPSGLSIFAEMDYKRRGQTIDFPKDEDLHMMRHYMITNCDEATPEKDDEDDIDIDSIEMGIQGINVDGAPAHLSNWTRSGMEGTSGDASVIQQVHAQAVDEPDDDLLDGDDDELDDTYIDDGVVAPAASVEHGQEDDEFFI